MQGNKLLLPLFVPGTLTANMHFEFIAPFDMTLEKISVNADDTTTFILDVGTTANTDLYVDAVTVTGEATTSVELGLADFVGTEHKHIVKGTMVVFTIDYDGGSGGDSAGISILATFGEG